MNRRGNYHRRFIEEAWKGNYITTLCYIFRKNINDLLHKMVFPRTYNN